MSTCIIHCCDVWTERLLKLTDGYDHEAAVALLRENYKSVLESVSSVLHQCGRAFCIFSSMFKVFMYLFSIARTETKTDVLFFTLRGKYKEPQFEQPFRGLLTFWTSQSERTEKTIHLFGIC